jgi:hypothetical protein
MIRSSVGRVAALAAGLAGSLAIAVSGAGPAAAADGADPGTAAVGGEPTSAPADAFGGGPSRENF